MQKRNEKQEYLITQAAHGGMRRVVRPARGFGHTRVPPTNAGDLHLTGWPLSALVLCPPPPTPSRSACLCI